MFNDTARKLEFLLRSEIKPQLCLLSLQLDIYYVSSKYTCIYMHNSNIQRAAVYNFSFPICTMLDKCTIMRFTRLSYI
jgi:hypothetical protein